MIAWMLISVYRIIIFSPRNSYIYGSYRRKLATTVRRPARRFCESGAPPADRGTHIRSRADSIGTVRRFVAVGGRLQTLSRGWGAVRSAAKRSG